MDDLMKMRKIAFYFLDPYGLVTADETEWFLAFLRRLYDISPSVPDDDYMTFRNYAKRFIEDTMHNAHIPQSKRS